MPSNGPEGFVCFDLYSSGGTRLIFCVCCLHSTYIVRYIRGAPRRVVLHFSTALCMCVYHTLLTHPAADVTRSGVCQEQGCPGLSCAGLASTGRPCCRLLAQEWVAGSSVCTGGLLGGHDSPFSQLLAHGCSQQHWDAPQPHRLSAFSKDHCGYHVEDGQLGGALLRLPAEGLVAGRPRRGPCPGLCVPCVMKDPGGPLAYGLCRSLYPRLLPAPLSGPLVGGCWFCDHFLKRLRRKAG